MRFTPSQDRAKGQLIALNKRSLTGPDGDDVQLLLGICGYAVDTRKLTQRSIQNIDALFNKTFEG